MILVQKIIAVASILFISCSYVYAKPAPPEELTEILGELSEVEESFESENWSGARASLEEVVELFDKVNNSHGEFVPVALRNSFLASAKGLDQFLDKQEEERAENSYIRLQVVLFEIMNYFDYKIHPVIAVLKKYIGDEAREALKDNNLDEVYSELKEVASFVTKNGGLLQQKGVKLEEMQAFMRSLGTAMQQVKEKDATALKTSLDSLESQVHEFEKVFI
jgi:hypothetical protein